MLALINRILEWFKSIFWKEEMELTLVGLQFSGKTTFVNVIAVSISHWVCASVRICKCMGGRVVFFLWGVQGGARESRGIDYDYRMVKEPHKPRGNVTTVCL